MNLNNSSIASRSAASPSNVITAPVYSESADRSSRPTTDTDTAKLQRDPNISPSSAMLTRCRARKRMTDATTITDRSSRPRKTANRSNNNEANPRQSQRLKRLSVTADAATAATTGTPNANVVVADVAAPTASSNHLNERENLLIDIAKVKTGRMVHERNGRSHISLRHRQDETWY